MSGYLNYFQAYSDRYSSNFYKRSLRVKKETPRSGVSLEDRRDRYSSNFYKQRLRDKKETPLSGVSFDDECDRYSSNFYKRQFVHKKETRCTSFFCCSLYLNVRAIHELPLLCLFLHNFLPKRTVLQVLFGLFSDRPFVLMVIIIFGKL